ncbi:MAG: hypothetical protein KC620_14415, partial [Myxococcales bacterium]|nr:hypothetical protein [Myxococcales bacterium]
DAATLGGRAAADFAAAGHGHSWGDIAGVPPDLADGDDNTTYDVAPGGGLELAAGLFGLTSACGEGQVLKRTADGWDCANDSIGDADAARLSEARLDGTELALVEGDRTLRVDLGALVEDDDPDPTNELLMRAGLQGAILGLTDAGGTIEVDLSPLFAGLDADATNELLQRATLNGTVLELTDAGGTIMVDLAALRGAADGDGDSTNELLQQAVLEGATLALTDAGGTLRVDLSALGDDADANPRNELLTGGRLNGTILELTDAGGTTSVELAALRDDADADPRNELVTGFALQGSTLLLDDAGGQHRIDLAPLLVDPDADPTNELIESLTLDGTFLVIGDAGGERRTDLSPISGRITGLRLEGQTLVITEAGVDQRLDLAPAVNDADSNPTNELQTLAIDANGNLSISGGNSVNVRGGSGFALSLNLGRSADDIAFPVALNADDSTTDVNLPFSVTYDGVAYNRVRISTNGWMEFGNATADSDLGNRALPATAHPGPFVAAYWDDLISSIRHGTEGTAPNRVFAVYFDAATFSGNTNIDFMIQVHEGSGAINVRYVNAEPNSCGQGATIGFQRAGAQNAIAYPIGFNVAVLDDNANDGDPSEQGWSVTPNR